VEYIFSEGVWGSGRAKNDSLLSIFAAFGVIFFTETSVESQP